MKKYKVWRSANGSVSKVSDMADSHIKNCQKFCARQAWKSLVYLAVFTLERARRFFIVPLTAVQTVDPLFPEEMIDSFLGANDEPH